MLEDDNWKRECLEDYVREHMTPHEFAAHVGLPRPHAYAVLNGKRWRQVPRPEGFQYPWPERENFGSRNSFRRRVHEYDEAVKRFEAEGWSLSKFAKHVNVHKGSAYGIIERVKLWRERGF